MGEIVLFKSVKAHSVDGDIRVSHTSTSDPAAAIYDNGYNGDHTIIDIRSLKENTVRLDRSMRTYKRYGRYHAYLRVSDIEEEIQR